MQGSDSDFHDLETMYREHHERMMKNDSEIPEYMTDSCQWYMKRKRTRVQAFIAAALYIGSGLAVWAVIAKLTYFLMNLPIPKI